MRALLLDASHTSAPAEVGVITQLHAGFTDRGATVETRVLREIPVAWCQGCFECWTHSPGTCKIDDAGRALADAWVGADVVVLVTPVRFGCYSSEGKKMLDRTLGTLLPFFRRVGGEVHHWPRYEAPPAFGVVAVLESDDADNERTLRALVERNALNVAAPTFAVETLPRHAPENCIAAVTERLVETLCQRGSSAREPMVANLEQALPSIPLAAEGDAPTRALLLVGSAKPVGTSTSERLGESLCARLATHGIVTETHYVHREAHNARGLATLCAAARACDLLIIASPLYFDALPALVTGAMEAIADDRAESPTPLTVAAVLNCGFPESHHIMVARATTALFARVTQARWAGALMLGGGGVLNGRPLADAGSVVAHLPAAIDRAADALACGRCIPAEASDVLARPLMPTALYMLAGDAGWLWTAAHSHTLTRLWRRPAGTAGSDHGDSAP